MTLPQFLLTYIQSRWVWAGFPPPLPAPNARWSIGRTLVFTVGQALVGALIGVVIGTLISLAAGGYHYGWLVWLLAYFSALQGLVGYGLTALCWNQRATRLRADPSLNISLPPTKTRVLRCLLGLTYFVLIAVITPAALLLTLENVRGELAWRRERARLVAKGEALEFRDLLGQPVPADQNAGAAEIFKPFFDYHYEPAPNNPALQNPVWHDSNAINHFEAVLKLPEDYRAKEDERKPSTPAVDLNSWAEAFRKLAKEPKDSDTNWAGELNLPASPDNPALDVLAGTSRARAQLSAICAASSLPRAQFPIHYEEGMDCLLRHLGELKSAMRMLELRCAAHLAAGDTNAAFDDAACAFKVAELPREEPLLISQLVRYANNVYAIRIIWQGLATHRWTDSQLSAFQEQLAALDFLPGAVLGFEGERACGITAINSWIQNPRTATGAFGPTENDSPARLPEILFSRSLLRQNEVSLARYNDQWLATLRTAISNAPKSGLNPMISMVTNASASRLFPSRTPYNMMIAMLAPATENAVKRTAKAQTLVRMAGVACALERYRLRHGAFPESLDELSPDLLGSKPIDPMNNQPFHYQRTDDGWFQLYSVGLNDRDDLGAFKTKQRDEELDWPWPVPTKPARFNLF